MCASDHSIINFPRYSQKKETALFLFREKSGRFSIYHEPFFLDRCVVCTESDPVEYFEVHEISTKDSFVFKVFYYLLLNSLFFILSVFKNVYIRKTLYPDVYNVINIQFIQQHSTHTMNEIITGAPSIYNILLKFERILVRFSTYVDKRCPKKSIIFVFF